MSNPSASIHSVSDGGVAGTHIVLPQPQVLVAPARADKEKEHNTIKPSLIPFACWRADDLRFEFDSSFVLPEIATEIGALRDLIESHTLPDEEGNKHRPAASVFGHADSTGSDDINKALSGRRAQSIYALLTRKVELWEDLYSNPLGNDKWEPKAIHRMQTTLGQPVSDHPSAGARKALFKAYMDKICTVADEKERGVPFEVNPEDFLAEGADAKGKGDFHGCGEFNPVLLVSQADKSKFDEAKDKSERNAANASNRRVLILLFRPGVHVKPDSWPCPRAKEGVDGCKKRFWSDGEKRRTNSEQQRQFPDTQDTFACRFYHRLLTQSPCEAVLATVLIRLFDREARALPFAPCLVTQPGKKPRPDRASGANQKKPEAPASPATKPRSPNDEVNEGAFIIVRDLKVPAIVNVKWNRPQPKDGPGSPLPKTTDKFEFDLDVVIDIPDDDKEKASMARLVNMGYVETPDQADPIRAFQHDYKPRFGGIEIDGKLNSSTQKAIKEVHDTCDPVLKRKR